MGKSRIDHLLEQQADELAALEQSHVAAVLAAYEDARRALHERLRVLTPGATPETEHRLRVMLAQAEHGVVELKQRLGVVLAGAEATSHRKAMRHLLKLVKTAEPTFTDSGGLVELAIVKRLAERQGLALHSFSVDRYGAQVVDAIQRELVSGVVQGMTTAELADRVAAAGGSVLSGLRGRAELIARMETSRAYNDAHLESIRELDTQDPRPDDPLLKKLDEFIDHRNHPFSRAAHERTARPLDPFVVPVAEVQAEAKAMRRPPGGILWQRVGGDYVGQNLPAHFNERGRIIAWRESWGPSRPSPPPPGPVAVPDPAPAPAPSPLAVVEDEIRGRHEEHAVLVLRDGTMVRTGPDFTRTMGADPRSTCAIPPAMSRQALADGDAVFTHNHPSGSPLSPLDLHLASTLWLREIRATRPDGGAWTVRRPETGWPPPAKVRQAAEDARTQATANAVTRMLVLIKRAGGNVSDGTKAKGYDEATWKALASEEYRRELEAGLDQLGLELALDE